jgi:hypothetical protein
VQAPLALRRCAKSIVAFRSAKVRLFRGAKNNFPISYFRAPSNSRSIYGVGTDGHRDEALGGGLVEVRSNLAAGDSGFLALSAAPLEDLGCGAWLYVDSSSTDGRLLLISEQGVYRTHQNIRSWLRLWLDDRASRANFFDASKASRKRGINPFTRQPMEFVAEGPPIGDLIHSWPEDE